MSQVKKLETGGTASAPSPKLKFRINGKDYEQDPQGLQDMFGGAFDDMVSKGVAKERNREDFFKTFQQFTSQANSGTYNINSSGGKYLNSTYDGPDGANLGVDERGNNSHKSAVGNIVSPFRRDDHQRMAILNTFLGDRLIQHHDADDNAAKAKADVDALKATGDKKAAQLAFINRYKTDYQTPGKAIFGADGADPNWALGDFWRGKDSDRVGGLTNAFKGVGSYVNDKQFDDADTQKLFKDTYGVDVNTLRQGLAKHGYENGNFKGPLDINGVDGIARDLQLRSNYENYFVRPGQTSASGSTTPTGQPTTPTKAPDGTPLANADERYKGFHKNKDGLVYENGKLYSGVRFTDTNRPDDFENEDNGYYWQGKNTDKDIFFHNASTSGDANLINSAQSINQSIAKRYGEYTNKLQDINYSPTNHEGFDRSNINEHFAFSDLINKGQKVPHVSEISNVYPDIQKNGQQRLYAYKANGKDRFGNDGVIRYRFVSPNGKIIDGKIQKGTDGLDYLTDGTTRVHLGVPTSDAAAASQTRDKPFYYGDFKDGGVIKAQLGAVLGGPKQDASFKSANVKDLFDKNGLSTADKIQLGGIAADLGGLVAGFVPGGSVVAAGAGVAGTVATATANYMKHGFQWGDVAGAAGGLALDAATLVPGLGEFAKFAKLSKGIKASATVVKAALLGAGALGAVKSLTKLTNDEHMNIDDWQAIAAGLQSAVVGKRMTDNLVATKGVTSNTINVGGKPMPISSAEATELGAASPSEAKGIAQRIVKDNGFEGELDLTDKTVKGFLNKFSAGKLGTPKTYEVPVTGQTKTKQLIDYDKANAYQRLAIRNTVAQNPKVAGAEDFIIQKPAQGGDAIRANNNSTKFGSWVGDSKKSNMIYSPMITGQKQLPASTGADFLGKQRFTTTPGTTPNDIVEVDGRQGMSSPVPQQPQLPPASANSKPGSFVTPYEDIAEANKTNVSPTAHQGPMADALQGKHQETVDDILGKIQLGDKEPGSTVAAVNNKYHADQLRSALGIKKGQSIKNAKVAFLFQGNGLTEEQSRIKDNFMRTDFGKGSYGEKLQKAVKGALNAPTSKGKGVKFKDGGAIQILVLKGQQGMAVPNFINGLSYNDFINHLNHADFLSQKQDLVPVNPAMAPSPFQTPKFATSVGTVNGYTPANPGASNGTDTGSSRYTGNKGVNLNLDFIKGIDPNTVSEAARALYTRQLNSQIDTRVERPMAQMPTEIATPVHGNLLASAAANEQANQTYQRAGQTNSSDPAIRVAAMLGANQQATALKLQGENANAQEIERTRGIQLQTDEQNAQARTNVANQNIQTLARATQAERAGENDKFGRMNQPIADFWKDQNYRGQVKAQQDKQYDTAIALQGRQNEFTQATRPMQDELNRIQFRQSQLESKQYSGQPLSDSENKEYESLTKRANDLSNLFTGYQNKYSTASLLTRKDPNYVLPTGYYSSVPFKKEGGAVQAAAINSASRVKVQEAKDNADNAQQAAKTQQEMIKNDQDTQAKKDLEASRQVAQLIKMALS